MTIKLIIFDLDGVLCDSRELHYITLNNALKSIDEKYIISREEHISTYDGLSTKSKLKLLTDKKGLPEKEYNNIWKRKQESTWLYIIENYTRDDKLIDIFTDLKKKNILIYVASNAVYNTVKLVLMKKEILPLVDYFLSNEDVVFPKPSSEIYFKCMIRAGVSVNETLIIEDSPIGRKAARGSGAFLLEVENPEDVNLKNIEKYLKTIMNRDEIKKEKWLGKCNVVIPASGLGTRFSSAGYSFPKPLIDVRNKPMLQVVVDNLKMNPDKVKFIFIVLKEHYDKYNLEFVLKMIYSNCIIITTEKVTEGAACSVLLAKKYIDNDVPLLVANSDQFVEFDINSFMYSMTNVDGGIVTFESTHPKWSYVKLNEEGFVNEVAEKIPISNMATVGIYYWKQGSDYVKYAEEMIHNNDRILGEFYFCPVYNYAIKDNKKIKAYKADKMWGLGIPEDLEYFLKNYEGEC